MLKSTGVSLTMALADVIGPVKGILLLTEIVKLWPYAKRFRDGRLWLYRSIDDWAEEIATPRKTVERYLATLRSGGWIETAAYKNVNAKGREYGPKILHTRPTDKLLALVDQRTGKPVSVPQIDKKAVTVGSSSPQKWGEVHLTPEVNSTSELGASYNTSYYIEKNIEPTKGDVPSVIASGGSQSSSFSGEISKETEAKAVDLAETWKAAWSKEYPGTIPVITPKDKKMLSDFRNNCQANAVAEHDADMLICVVQRWGRFTADAKEKSTAFKLPDRPDIGFILKYFGVAVNFWLEERELVLVNGKPVAKPKTAKLKMKSGW